MPVTVSEREGDALQLFQGHLLGEWLDDLDTFQRDQRGFANDVRVMYHLRKSTDSYSATWEFVLIH